MVKDVSSKDLRTLVVTERKPAIVLFSAEWCGDCLAFKPLWNKWARAHKGPLYKLDVGERSDPSWDEWEIDEIPTVVAFKEGEEKARAQGVILERDLDDLVGKI